MEVHMKKLFHLEEHHTTIRTEIGAGLTTFFAMAYIIFLNPVFLSSTGMDSDGVLVSVCLAAALGTLLCALFSNKPFALAPGMGMNAFFAYTLCGICGYTWQQALALTFIAGLVFLAVAISPLREKIIHAIPTNLKYAISAGIGLFIAVIGLLDAGIITMTEGYPALGNLGDLGVQLALFGLLVTIILTVCHVKGSLIIGMLLTVFASLILGQTAVPEQIVSFPSAISKVCLKMDFTGLLPEASISALITLAALILSMAMVDMFDTLGFLIGTGARADMLTEDGDFPDAKGVLVADASATVLGALLGSSTVTVYAESATGIAAGGKTGLTSFTTAICFVLAAFFSPLTSVVTASATAPALIIVGMYLVMEVTKVNFEQMDDAIPAFLTIIAMPFAYSITTGIAVGFIAHVICKVTAKKWKELNASVLVLAFVFLLYFFL